MTRRRGAFGGGIARALLVPAVAVVALPAVAVRRATSAAADRLVPMLASAVLARLDLDAVAARIDVDALVDRVDIDRVLARTDVAGLARYVAAEIDLPALLRATAGTGEVSDTRRPEERPWHDAAPPAVLALGRRAALRGARAGIVSRVLANGIDGVVVVLLVVAGYLAVIGVRFVLSPITFVLPVPSSAGAVAALLATQVLYLAVAWAALGATYGDRMLVSRRNRSVQDLVLRTAVVYA